nr:hypothetical protein CFP56_48790 [Quercus suber]
MGGEWFHSTSLCTIVNNKPADDRIFHEILGMHMKNTVWRRRVLLLVHKMTSSNCLYKVCSKVDVKFLPPPFASLRLLLAFARVLLGRELDSQASNEYELQDQPRDPPGSALPGCHRTKRYKEPWPDREITFIMTLAEERGWVFYIVNEALDQHHLWHLLLRYAAFHLLDHRAASFRRGVHLESYDTTDTQIESQEICCVLSLRGQTCRAFIWRLQKLSMPFSSTLAGRRSVTVSLWHDQASPAIHAARDIYTQINSCGALDLSCFRGRHIVRRCRYVGLSGARSSGKKTTLTFHEQYIPKRYTTERHIRYLRALAGACFTAPPTRNHVPLNTASSDRPL